jgi:type IV secretory pathway TrbD component
VRVSSPPGPLAGQSTRVRARRLGLVAAMVLLTLNLWTGGPLLALWIGSRLDHSTRPSMLAIAVVAVALGVVSYALVRLLARLDEAYARVTGRRSTVRRHVPWLRSMRGERPHEVATRDGLSPLEIVLVSWVVVVVVLFEIWFFFYSPSPIDQRTGRDHDAPLIGEAPAGVYLGQTTRRSNVPARRCRMCATGAAATASPARGSCARRGSAPSRPRSA